MEFDPKTFDYKKYVENEVWKTFRVRPRPEPTREQRLFMTLAFAVFITAGGIIGYFTNQYSLALIFAFVGALGSYAIAFPRRCPKCGGRMITRRVDDEDDPENYYYFFNDCPKCEISWQSKRICQSGS